MLISRLRNWFAGFFYFNKQERNGVFMLCLILSAVLLFRLFLPLLLDGDDRLQSMDAEANTVSGPEKNEVVVPEHKFSEQNKQKSFEKFVFNPNTVTAEEARSLGFSEKLSATLIRFRNKGGKFFRAEDLKKLYGMSPKLYAALEAYILISNKRTNFHRDTVYPKRSYEKKAFPKSLVELNAADSTAIVFLKGIGPGFTKRILKYRTLLGGFHSPEQLKEIYGMNDSTYMIFASQILIDKSLVTKIPLNAIDLNSLRKHPYFNFQSAQALINYRNKHGKLSEQDVKNLGVIPADKLALILPYLEY